THWRVGMQLEYDTVNQQAYLAWGGTWYSVANADLSLTQLYAGFSYDTSRMGSAIDPARRTMFILGNGRAYGFNLDTNTQTSYSAATGMDLIKDCNAPGVEYASHLDKYVAWCGGNDLFLIDPVNFTVTTLVTTGLAPGTSGSVGNGIYGRFRYSEKYGGLVVAYSISSDVYFVHLHDTGIGGTPPANNVYPQITDLSPQTTPESIPLIIDGRSGDRPEIGLFTEWQSEFFVTGAHAQHILDQADDRLDEPWCDMAKMTAKPWAPVEGYAGNVSFSHQPNAFFVPYLETGDVKYVVPMECTWQIYQEFRQKLQYAAMMHYTGRDGAWMLRNLGELAYIEKLGDTLAADHTQENAVLSAIYNFTRARVWDDADALPSTDIANEVKQLGQDIYDNYVNGVAYGSMNLDAIEADIQTYIDTLPVGWNRSAIQAAKDHIAAMRAGVSFPYYQTILKHTLYKYMLDTVQPVQRGFNAIGVRQFGTPTWTGWMESFNGQVIYHIVDLMQAAGDSAEEANWLTLAEWHFQHLIARCGGTVGMIYCDNDHVSPVTDWSDTNLYSQERLDQLVGEPVTELPPKYKNGVWITYDDRIDNARTWAAMAAENGTPGAQALYDSIQAAIVTRDGAGGATNWYKYSIEVPQ
ncbi:MAG: hypothetical protein KDA17_03780, partial [Candidatus Saccharibacteria bacterium]|nr:hypothetical protein [Candidatus Saccharibacteria bacterium]